MYRILIKDRDNYRFLTVSFIDLLQSIDDFNKDYFWSLYELDASVKTGGIPGYSDLINKIDSSQTGYCISWNELKNLAEGLDQVINLILVASDKKNDFELYNDSNKWKDKYKISIEIVDGDYWEIYTPNEKLMSFIYNKYNDTEVSIINLDEKYTQQ